MRFSALQVYSPMSAFVALLSFRQATPFEYSNLQVGLDLTLPSALNQDTLISGVPATRHLRHTASPAVTSMGSRDSTKYAGSAAKKKKPLKLQRSLKPAGDGRYCTQDHCSHDLAALTAAGVNAVLLVTGQK